MNLNTLFPFPTKFRVMGVYTNLPQVLAKKIYLYIAIPFPEPRKNLSSLLVQYPKIMHYTFCFSSSFNEFWAASYKLNSTQHQSGFSLKRSITPNPRLFCVMCWCYDEFYASVASLNICKVRLLVNHLGSFCVHICVGVFGRACTLNFLQCVLKKSFLLGSGLIVHNARSLLHHKVCIITP